ncbi:MAG: hypothetical protein ACRDSZ_22210 [Pseudonocardiaceae bacterium]
MSGAVTVDELRSGRGPAGATHDPASTGRLEFLRARFDTGWRGRTSRWGWA